MLPVLIAFNCKVLAAVVMKNKNGFHSVKLFFLIKLLVVLNKNDIYFIHLSIAFQDKNAVNFLPRFRVIFRLFPHFL